MRGRFKYRSVIFGAVKALLVIAVITVIYMIQHSEVLIYPLFLFGFALRGSTKTSFGIAVYFVKEI